jgi:ATP-binding cassette subfamily B (MDR/TAP) protein 10
MVNTLADLRGMLAAVERVNNVVASAQVDEWLAHGLEREARGELQGNGDCVNPTTNEIVASEEDAINGSTIPLKVATSNLPAVESQRTVCDLAWSGDVVLEDVHFAYPLRPETYVLKGITLKLDRGTVTAVVGSSGAGKSTIVQLLARFYEPSDGRITLGGTDVRKFDKTEWARAVSLVNQVSVLCLAFYNFC